MHDAEPAIIGKSNGWTPLREDDNFMRVWFDMRDLGQVFAHVWPHGPSASSSSSSSSNAFPQSSRRSRQPSLQPRARLSKSGVLRKIPFIPPMAPMLAQVPPSGPEWLHEVKLDGWRAQVHVEKGAGTIYSKGGSDITRRFCALGETIAAFPARSAVLDCELIACDSAGRPCFKTLMELGGRAPALCLWAFDLLYLDGARMTALPLVQRRAMLSDLVADARDPHLQFSGEFENPLEVLASASSMVEGVVSKRRDSAYRSGPTKDCLKTKTAAWRAANAGRGEMFKARAGK